MKATWKKASLWAVVAFAPVGCTKPLSGPVRFVDAPQDYEVKVTPMDTESRFAVELISHSSRDLCMGIDDWPNALGQISGGPERAKVFADGRAFPAADTNFGYCVGKTCTLRIKPRQTLRGVIGYKEFGEPREIAALNGKRLEYHVRPFICTGTN